MTYKAPIKDMLFDMEQFQPRIEQVAQIPGFEEMGWKPRRLFRRMRQALKAWSA